MHPSLPACYNKITIQPDTGGKESVQFGEYLIEDGVCKMADRSAFHGSIATTDRLLRTAVLEAKIPMEEAVRMMTETPAAIMGLKTKGSLEAGFDGDLVVLTEDLQVKTVICGGETVVSH